MGTAISANSLSLSESPSTTINIDDEPLYSSMIILNSSTIGLSSGKRLVIEVVNSNCADIPTIIIVMTNKTNAVHQGFLAINVAKLFNNFSLMISPSILNVKF